MFNFAAHRRPEQYAAITERAGVIEPATLDVVKHHAAVAARKGADMTRLWFSVGFAALLAVATTEAAELPDAIKQAGTLRLTVNSTYAPMDIAIPRRTSSSGSTSISQTNLRSGSA